MSINTINNAVKGIRKITMRERATEWIEKHLSPDQIFDILENLQIPVSIQTKCRGLSMAGASPQQIASLLLSHNYEITDIEKGLQGIREVNKATRIQILESLQA